MKFNKNIDMDFDLLLDKLSKLGVFIQDIENGEAYPNYIWSELGYSPEEMLNMGFLDFVHPEDRQNVQKSINDFILEKDKLVRSLFRIKSKEGNWHWILSSALGAECDKDGKITKYIGYDHDVTEEIEEKKKAEKALKEAETLRSAGEIITSQLDLPHTINAILEQAKRVISFTSASVQILVEDELEIIGESGFDPAKHITGIRFSINQKIPNSKIIEKRTSFIVNTNICEKYPDFKDLSDRGIQSWMGIPLIYKRKLTGMLVFDHFKDGKFTSEDIRPAEAFAHQVAIALENSRLYEATKELAIKDPLTGSYTRRHLYDILIRECDMAKRYNNPLSVILFDLDNFKNINDTYGHLIGDAVLKEVVTLSLGTLRKSDVLCRFGGEEFVVILPLCSIDEAYSASERIRNSINNDIEITELKEGITVSLGCTSYDLKDERNIDKIIGRADKALYQSKKNGKNQTTCL